MCGGVKFNQTRTFEALKGIRYATEGLRLSQTFHTSGGQRVKCVDRHYRSPRDKVRSLACGNLRTRTSIQFLRRAGPPLRKPQGLCFSNRLESDEHTSELQSLAYLVCRLLLEKKKK